MTNEEIRKIGEVLAEANGGCPHCVGALTAAFAATFPGVSVVPLWEGIEKSLGKEDADKAREARSKTSLFCADK